MLSCSRNEEKVYEILARNLTQWFSTHFVTHFVTNKEKETIREGRA
jgi:hypothetical protein